VSNAVELLGDNAVAEKYSSRIQIHATHSAQFEFYDAKGVTIPWLTLELQL
jgi:hypothetical protein